MMEEEKHISQASAAVIVGRIFGIVAERFAYGLVICIISLRFTEAVTVLDGIDVMFEEASKELERKIKDHDQTD